MEGNQLAWFGDVSWSWDRWCWTPSRAAPGKEMEMLRNVMELKLEVLVREEKESISERPQDARVLHSAGFLDAIRDDVVVSKQTAIDIPHSTRSSVDTGSTISVLVNHPQYREAQEYEDFTSLDAIEVQLLVHPSGAHSSEFVHTPDSGSPSLPNFLLPGRAPVRPFGSRNRLFNVTALGTPATTTEDSRAVT